MAVIYKLYHIVVRGDDESYEKASEYFLQAYWLE